MANDRVFASWSGAKSRHYATCFTTLIEHVIQGIDVYLSHATNRAGDRWFHVLSSALEESNFGVVFLTSGNKAEPWLYFEAGACSKAVSDSRLCPVLIDLEIEDIGPPLSLFHAKTVEKSQMYDLVVSINEGRESPVDPAVLSDTFNKYWPDFEKCIGEFKDDPNAPKPEKRGVEEKIDEILTLVRGNRRSGAQMTARSLPWMSETATSAAFDEDIEWPHLSEIDRRRLSDALTRRSAWLHGEQMHPAKAKAHRERQAKRTEKQEPEHVEADPANEGSIEDAQSDD